MSVWLLHRRAPKHAFWSLYGWVLGWILFGAVGERYGHLLLLLLWFIALVGLLSLVWDGSSLGRRKSAMTECFGL
jgi:hypothetical protein